MTKLASVMQEKNITVAKLARILKIVPSSVCLRRKNGIQSMATARKYAKALDVNASDLIEC